MMQAEFIRVWATFSILIFTAVGIAAWWARRAGQFRDQERARSLPLTAWVEEGAEGDKTGEN